MRLGGRAHKKSTSGLSLEEREVRESFTLICYRYQASLDGLSGFNYAVIGVLNLLAINPESELGEDDATRCSGKGIMIRYFGE